ncbi:MAG: hypothetical protein GXY83_12690, partial [Rhodopirellula sp.]|nr:hypothetical protein [Rhodopirellula sp.]
MWTSRLFGKRNKTRRSSARGTQTKPAGLGRHLKERRLQMEPLEQRQLLAVDAFIANNALGVSTLWVFDDAGFIVTPNQIQENDVTISRSGTLVRVSDPNGVFSSGATNTGPGYAEFDTANFDNFHIDLQDGDDTLTFANSFTSDDIEAINIEGGGPSDSDGLFLNGVTGAVAQTVIISPDNSNPDETDIVGYAGLATINARGYELIRYTGADTDDTLAVALGDGNDDARVEDAEQWVDRVISSSLPVIEYTGLDTFVLDMTLGLDTATFATGALFGALPGNYEVAGTLGDVLTIEGFAGATASGSLNDNIRVTNPAAGLVAVTHVNADSGPLTVTVTTGSVGQVQVLGLGGDDSVTVDVDSATPSDLVSVPILFDGGDGADTLTVSGTPVTAVDEVIYSPGPAVGQGRLEYESAGGTRLMLVEFANLEPVVDLVPAATMTVNGTAADNAINYTQGSLAARGLVTVDAYESIEFSNKTNLILNGLAGSDEINLNNPSTPTGLTGIIVNGGDPTASDTLIVNSRVGIQEFLLIVPTGTGAGRIQDQGFTTDGIDASYTGIEHLKVVGQEADGDSLGTTNTDDRDVNIVTPAATPDAGRMTGYSTGNVSGVPFAYVPVEYSGFINYVTGFSNVFVAGAEPDLLIVEGTNADDHIELAELFVDAPTPRDFASVVVNDRPPVVYNINSTQTVELRGLEGDDTFDVAFPLETWAGSIRVEGGGPGASDVLNITADTDPGAAETVTITPDAVNPLEQDITGLQNPIDVAGIELIAFTGTDSNDTLRLTPVADDQMRVDDAVASFVGRVTSTSFPEIHFGSLETFIIAGSSFGSVEATFATRFLDSGTDYQFEGFHEDKLVIEGLDGDADSYLAVNGGANGSVAVTDSSGVTVTNTVLGAPAPGQLLFRTLGGDDIVTVDNSAGLIETPIHFEGGVGSDSLHLTGNTAVTTAEYTPGATNDSGTIVHSIAGGPTQTVSFTGLEPVLDNVAAGNLIINGTNGDNAINYTAGPGGGIFGANLTGLVSVDAFETYEFSQKTTLTLNGLAGSDTINLNNPSTPTGLTGITVNGGDPTGSDTLIVNGIAGTADSYLYTPTGVGAGTVVNPPGGPALQPTVTFSGTEHLSVVAQSADADIFRITGTTNSDTFELTPGASIDTFTATGFSVGAGAFNFVPVTFSGFRAFIAAPTNFGPVGGSDTLIVNGTSADDVITLLPQTGFLAFPAITVNGSTEITFGSIAGKVDEVILRGLEGNDTFNIAFDATTDAQFRDLTVRVQGGDSDASSDVLNYTGTGGNISIDFQNQVLTEVGFGPVAFTGVERLNVDAANADVVVLGGPDDDQFIVTPDVTAIEVFREGFTPLVRVNNVDEFDVDGLGGVNELTVIATEAANTIDIDDDEVNITGRQFVDYVNIANLNVFGLAGDDTFNVTTSATSPTIFIDGGDPIGETPGDQINVDAGGLGVALEAGPETDEGGIIVGAHERISFDHIEGVSIANVACALIIGTNADDDITVIARDASTHPLADGVQDFTTSVNGGLTILWIDVNELYIDALAGDDDIVLRTPAPNDAEWGVNVHISGGAPSAGPDLSEGDRLVLETPGSDNIVFTPTGSDTATILIDEAVNDSLITIGQFTTVACPDLNYTSDPGGIELFVYDGEAGDDSLTINTFWIDGTQVLTPAVQFDAGNIQFQDNAFQNFVSSPLYFEGLGNGGSLTFTDVGRIDTLVYRGTDTDDDFDVDPAGVVLLNTRIPVNTPGIADLVLQGLDGDDTFVLHGQLPFNAVYVEGGNTSVGDVVVLVAPQQDVDVFIRPNDVELSVTDITGLGSPIMTTGVEDILFEGKEAYDQDLTVDLGRGTAVARVENWVLSGTDRVSSNVLPNVHFTRVEDFQLEGGNEPTIATFAIVGLEGAETYTYDSQSPGDSLIIEGTADADDFTASLDGSGNEQVTAVYAEGPTTVNTLNMDGQDELVLDMLGGNDLVTVDVDGTDVIDTPIVVKGGAGYDDLVVTGTPSPNNVDEVIYTVGPLADRGRILYEDVNDARLMWIEFTELEPVHDYVPANLTVYGNHAANAINYTVGPNSGDNQLPNPGNPLNPGDVETGLISVDAYETIEFGNKLAVNIDGRAGDDDVNVADTSHPGASGALTLAGNDPSASDAVVLNGTTGTDTVVIEITGPHSATVTINLDTTLVYTTEKLIYNGLGGEDNVSVLGILGIADGDNRFVFTPGPARDSGSITGYHDAAATDVPFLPIDLLELGVAGSIEFVGNSVGTNTLVVMGTDGRDIVDVAATTGNITVTTPVGAYVELRNDNIDNLEIETLEGDDDVNLVFPLSVFSSIRVNGGDPSASDLLTIEAGSGRITPSSSEPAETIISGLGAGNPDVVTTGIEHILFDGIGSAADLTVDLGNGMATARVDVSPLSNTDRVVSNVLPTVLFTDVNDFQLEGGNEPTTATFAAAGLEGADTYTFDSKSDGDRLIVEGTEDVDTMTVSVDGGGNLQVDNVYGLVPVADTINTIGMDITDELALYTLGGADLITVDVDSPNSPVFVDGGNPIGVIPGDTLVVKQAFAFFAGPEVDEGGFFTLGGTVSYDHIESLVVDTPDNGNGGCTFIIFGTDGDDDITVIARDASTHAGADGVQDFTVSVNGGPELFFIDQPSLAIEALAGDDD